MEIQRNAPNLSGAKPCPSCGETIARDASACIHCGYNLATGARTRSCNCRNARRSWLILAAVALAAGATSVWLRPKAPGSTPAPAPEPAAPAPVAAAAAPAEADFAARKAAAALEFRAALDAREPLFKLNDNVELRRKNGIVDKGILTDIRGTGAARMALLATPVGEIGVPMNTLDSPSRRRVDSLYREAYIQHMLSLGGEPPPESPAAE